MQLLFSQHWYLAQVAKVKEREMSYTDQVKRLRKTASNLFF